MTSTVPMHGNSTWVTKDIVFDQPIDAKLFSLDPPDGYQDLAKLEEESPKQQLNAGSIAKALVFAEIVAALQAELEKAKSLQYNSSWTQTLPDGKRLPAIVHQTKILGNQLKRTETIDVKPGDIEADFSGPFGRSIEIVDLQKKKKAALYPEIKGYMVMDWDGTFADAYIPSKDEAAKIEKKLEEQKAARDKVEAAAKKKGDADKSKSKGYTGNVFIAGKSSLEGAKPHAPSDIFELILHVPTDKAKQLPAKKIGDKDVVGFQVEQQETHKDITTNWRHTWWVDPKTKLPVQLEILNNNPHVKDEKIISDIAFDAPLDSSLFSIEMPADYIDIEKARAQSQPVKHDPNQPPTLRFTQVENLKTKDGKQAPELVKQVTIWANNLRREEVTLKAGGDDQLAVANGIRSHVRIQDTKQKKSIVLLPDKKEYLDTTKTAFTSDYDWLAMQSASDGKPPQLDIFGALQLQPKNLKRLPLQTIDGKLALGQVFEQEFERKAGTDTWQRTQWRDLFTSQPIRIEAKFRSTDPSLPDIDWVMRDFVEGVPVDRAQFSLDPPEGYTLQKK
jgi:outer membrane lipoprotein-sorting protein